MAPASRFLFDPTRDTASVLRRIGVLVLMVGLPLGAAATRTGAVIAYAIGIVLLVAAASLDISPRRLRETLSGLVASPVFLAMAVAAGWAALSLVWTPAPAWRNAGGITAILGLGIAGYAALPERMRSANLYPIPVGTGALALLSIAFVAGIIDDDEVEGVRQLERALAVLVLFSWPAIAWLRSRGRDIEALALALGAAGAAAFGPGPAPIIALAAGAVAYLLAQLSLRGAAWIGLALAALLLLTPALLAWGQAGQGLGDWSAGIARWRGALLGEPARLLTGHGAGALRLRPDLPEIVASPVLALWYELGIVGVAAVAFAFAASLRRAGESFGPLLPGLAAAAVTAFVLGASGIGGGALWWPVALTTVILLFVATQRGQFRTRRPRAIIGLGRSNTT